jgi:hypothetical protein
MVARSRPVAPSAPAALSSLCRGFALLGLVFAGACATAEPIVVQATLSPTPALAALRPSDIAVLPVEDGTPDAAAAEQLGSLREEIMRQLVRRGYVPLTGLTVDLALKSQRAADASARRDSILAPASMQKVAGKCGENAVFGLRVEQWDDSRLMSAERVRFRFQAVMMASDGQLLWSGSLQGEVKAGGAGAAPRDRGSMARSCGLLAIGELLQRLPERTRAVAK